MKEQDRGSPCFFFFLLLRTRCSCPFSWPPLGKVKVLKEWLKAALFASQPAEKCDLSPLTTAPITHLHPPIRRWGLLLLLQLALAEITCTCSHVCKGGGCSNIWTAVSWEGNLKSQRFTGWRGHGKYVSSHPLASKEGERSEFWDATFKNLSGECGNLRRCWVTPAVTGNSPPVRSGTHSFHALTWGIPCPFLTRPVGSLLSLQLWDKVMTLRLR